MFLGEVFDGKLMDKNKQLLDLIGQVLLSYEPGEKKNNAPNKNLSS